MIVYIDPIEVTAIEKADYIFITHSHPDHLSINDIKVPRDNLTVKDNRKLYRNCHKTIKEHW
ncbi:MAG TPA: hypothetical protein VHO90_08385 [Bacteroidales bacterium]|nr:hypothetical protein [Bacteroidales bacterium]